MPERVRKKTRGGSSEIVGMVGLAKGLSFRTDFCVAGALGECSLPFILIFSVLLGSFLQNSI